MRFLMFVIVFVSGCHVITDTKLKDGEASTYIEHTLEDNKTKVGTKVSFKF